MRFRLYFWIHEHTHHNMSSWGKKLDAKLLTLGDSSSTETLQTVAKWVSFNRKRSTDFRPVLIDAIRASPPERQAMLIKLIHQVIIQERGSEKWEKMAELRLEMGETILFTVAEELGLPARKVMEEYFQEWDDDNVFGGPTVLSQIKRKLASDSAKKEETTKAADSPVSPREPLSTLDDTNANVELPEESPTRLSSSNQRMSSLQMDVDYDFERTGIPEQPVPVKDLIEPAKQLASLQIARDIRNDSAIQLSSLLSGLPKDVREVCAQAAADTEPYELKPEQAEAFSKSIHETLININLEEQLASVQLFRSILAQQNKARRRAIELLIQCRAKVGAVEAVEEFLKADRAQDQLKKRKQVLVDALELEGVAPDEDEAKRDPATEDNLEVPSWYQQGTSGPPVKRIKVEESI